MPRRRPQLGPRPRTPRWPKGPWCACCLVALWGWAWGAAHAQGGPPSIACEPRQDAVHCQLFLLPSMQEPTMVQRLKSGLLNRFLYRIYIRRLEDDEPVHLAAYQLLEAYDLWDEVFYLSEDEQGRDKRAVPGPAELAAQLGRFDGLVLASKLPPGNYYADLIVELNPLSAADEAELRSWIARNRGGHRSFANGERSLFGTFVSLFINIRPGNAEWSLRARSAPFRVP